MLEFYTLLVVGWRSWGGELTVNKEKKTITVTSVLFFYGAKATYELANSLAKGIENYWNNANGKYTDLSSQ
ncbi:MAG: hypothetical protein PHR83_04385 [Paludibacter sp.]|nr:hypothetical protein [Paludibacter sp.]